MRTLILGIGNVMLSDDGIGARLADDLEKEIVGDNVYFDSLLVAGLDIIEKIRNFDSLIVIDGIMTGRDAPGTLKYFSLDDCPPTLHLQTFHDVHLRESILLARLSGIHVPEIIHIITIEIFDDLTFSHSLSAPLDHVYPEKVSHTKRMLTQFINNPSIVQRHEQIQ